MNDHSTTFLAIIFTLMDRGLSSEQIDRAMKQVVGPDWREVPVAVWFLRLQAKQFLQDITEDRYVDELEALIIGRIKMDQMDKMNIEA